MRELWKLIQLPNVGLELQSHRYHLRTYHNCFIGSKLVDWLVRKDKASNKQQALLIGQALVDAQWLECVAPLDDKFSDEYSLYKPRQVRLSTLSFPNSLLHCCESIDMDLNWFSLFQATSLEEETVLLETSETHAVADTSDPEWIKDIEGREKGTSQYFNASPSLLMNKLL